MLCTLKAWTYGFCMAALLSLQSLPVAAHPGGLDSKGCHTNRKTGDYHCHRSQSGGSTSDGPAVKKSSSGICHDHESPYYSQTKKFTAHESVKACLDSGGRLPK